MAQFTGSLVVKGNVSASNGITGSLLGTATKADTVYVTNYDGYNGNQRIAYVGGVNQHHSLRADTAFNFNPGQNRLIVPNATFSGNVKAQLISQSAQVTLADTTGNISGSRVVGDIQASSVEFTNVLNKPFIVSSSQQIESLGFVTMSTTIISSSTQIFNTIRNEYITSSISVISSSNQIIQNIGTSYITSSISVVSSSTQIDFTQITNTGGIVSSSTQVVAALPAGTVSGSAQIDLALATGTAANATAAVTANTASYVSGSNIDGEVYEAERARRIEVGSYGSYSTLTDIPFITGDYGNSVKRISADGFLQWHAGTNHLTVPGVDATTLTGSLDWDHLKNVPAGIMSSSDGIVPDGTISGSQQVVDSLPAGTVSGSQQVVAALPAGTVSGSSQVQSNLPAGLISSSDQVNANSILNFDSNVESALNNNSVNFGTGTVTADVLTTQRINSETDSAENITFEDQRIKFRVGEGYQTGQEVFTIERDTDGAYDVTVFKGYSTSANFQVRGNSLNDLLLVKSSFNKVAIAGDVGDEVFAVNGSQTIDNGILRIFQDGGGFQKRNLIIGHNAARSIHNGNNYTSSFHSNTVIGDQALYNADDSSNNNVIMGDWIAYEYSDMGQYRQSVIVGNQASRYGVGVNRSVALGYSALSTGGDNAVAVGYAALAGHRAGEYNIGIGNLTGYYASSSTSDYNVYIGYKAGPEYSDSDTLKKADSQLYIAYDDGEQALVRGDMRRRNFRLNVTDDYQYSNRIGAPGFYVTGSSYFSGSVDVYNNELNVHNGLVVTGSVKGIAFNDLDSIPEGILSSSGQMDVRSFGGDGSVTGSLKVTSFVTASEFKGNASSATKIDGFTNMNDVAGNFPLLITARSESAYQGDGEIGFTGPTTSGGGLFFNPDRSGNNTDCQLTIGNAGNTGILDVDKIDVGVDILIHEGTINMTGIQNGGDIRFYNLDGFSGDPSNSSVGSLWRSGANLYYRSQTNEKAKIVTDTDEVLKIAQSDPLPTGGVGQLAVSASNLYFHNGTSWSQIN